ncbi:MAG TPA: hypothetical protein VNK04_14140 [Gemmataceae bacterium]|nr:hypothetical protein [Gemmataceae bacterium]
MAESIPGPGFAGSEAPAESPGYQPLSLLAIIGCALAALYGTVVLVGFAASILFGSPWLMPLWTLVFPLVAMGLALVARSQIRRSEGTLAGTALANWAISLSVLFGLIFLSHTGATYLVLRGQAESFTRQWFDRLREGDLDGAFRLTLRPENRPAEGPGLHSELENRFNTLSEVSRRGLYGAFEQRPEVRLLLLAGSQAEVKLLGIKNWDYVEGGYKVSQTYQVTTPDATFDLQVVVHGIKGTQREFQGRQWYLTPEVQITQLNFTSRGANLSALQKSAQEFVGQWQADLRAGRAAAPAADLVQLNEQRFWPPEPSKRSLALTEVRNLCQQPELLANFLEVDQSLRVLMHRRDGDRLRFLQDVQFTLAQKHVVDGFLLVECDAKAVETGPPVAWRLAGIELTRIRDLPSGRGLD